MFRALGVVEFSRMEVETVQTEGVATESKLRDIRENHIVCCRYFRVCFVTLE